MPTHCNVMYHRKKKTHTQDLQSQREKTLQMFQNNSNSKQNNYLGMVLWKYTESVVDGNLNYRMSVAYTTPLGPAVTVWNTMQNNFQKSYDICDRQCDRTGLI